MQNNLKVAITGGIGSGKTTVADIIAEQGFIVLSCDKIYNDLLNDGSFLDCLCIEFGNVLTDDGKLDRTKLSSIVFNDKEKLKKLNEITHPAIMKEALRQMTGNGIFFCEVPLLFEGGFERLFDKVIVVMRTCEGRIEALSKRDGMDKKDAIVRIKSQFDYDSVKLEKYYVINNDSDFTELRRKTIEIVEKLKSC